MSTASLVRLRPWWKANSSSRPLSGRRELARDLVKASSQECAPLALAACRRARGRAAARGGTGGWAAWPRAQSLPREFGSFGLPSTLMIRPSLTIPVTRRPSSRLAHPWMHSRSCLVRVGEAVFLLGPGAADAGGRPHGGSRRARPRFSSWRPARARAPAGVGRRCARRRGRRRPSAGRAADGHGGRHACAGTPASGVAIVVRRGPATRTRVGVGSSSAPPRGSWTPTPSRVVSSVAYQVRGFVPSVAQLLEVTALLELGLQTRSANGSFRSPNTRASLGQVVTQAGSMSFSSRWVQLWHLTAWFATGSM